MLRKLLVAGGVAVAAASVPGFLKNDSGLLDRRAEPEARHVSAPAGPQERRSAMQGGRSVSLAADAGGHFEADFRLNGRPVPALIDTGATLVAINRSTARRIGIDVKQGDFTGWVETANGRVRAAGVIIDRIEIGRIEHRDVRAMVLEDRALSQALIGMSFLSRLSRFQVEGGALLLEQ